MAPLVIILAYINFCASFQCCLTACWSKTIILIRMYILLFTSDHKHPIFNTEQDSLIHLRVTSHLSSFSPPGHIQSCGDHNNSQGTAFLMAPGSPGNSSALSLWPTFQGQKLTYCSLCEGSLGRSDCWSLTCCYCSTMSFPSLWWPFYWLCPFGWLTDASHITPFLLVHTAFAWLAQWDRWLLEAPGAAAGTTGWRNICLLSPLISTVTVTVLH